MLKTELFDFNFKCFFALQSDKSDTIRLKINFCNFYKKKKKH